MLEKVRILALFNFSTFLAMLIWPLLISKKSDLRPQQANSLFDKNVDFDDKFLSKTSRNQLICVKNPVAPDSGPVNDF